MARVASLGALLGHANDVVDLGRPTYEEVAQVGPHALRLLLTRLRVGRAREEGVPACLAVVARRLEVLS